MGLLGGRAVEVRFARFRFEHDCALLPLEWEGSGLYLLPCATSFPSLVC
jgi:hypothetical protein